MNSNRAEMYNFSLEDNFKQSRTERLGKQPSYRHITYQGISRGGSLKLTEIVDLVDLPFEVINNFDKKYCNKKRSAFLRCWINQKDCRAIGFMKDGKLAGYGVITTCPEGHKVEPLIAENREVADMLFLSLVSNLRAEEKFYIEVPEINRAAVVLAKNYLMTSVSKTEKKYTLDSRDFPINHIYGVTSFELG